MNVAKIVGASLLAIVLLVGLGVAGWQFEWWLKGKNVDKSVELRNNNVGVQTAWRDEATDLMNKIEVMPENAPARRNLTNQACDLIGRLNDNYRSPEIDSFEAVNC